MNFLCSDKSDKQIVVLFSLCFLRNNSLWGMGCPIFTEKYMQAPMTLPSQSIFSLDQENNIQRYRQMTFHDPSKYFIIYYKVSYTSYDTIWTI